MVLPQVSVWDIAARRNHGAAGPARMGICHQPGLHMSGGAGDFLSGTTDGRILLCALGDDRAGDGTNDAPFVNHAQQPRAGAVFRGLGVVLSARLVSQRTLATRSYGWPAARLRRNDSLYRSAVAVSAISAGVAARRSTHRAQTADRPEDSRPAAGWTTWHRCDLACEL